MYGINDPSALLRPWQGLQQFTEELYAMFSPSGQQDDGSPGQVRSQPADFGSSPSGRSLGDQNYQFNSVRNSRIEDTFSRTPSPDQLGQSRNSSFQPRSQPSAPSYEFNSAPSPVQPIPVPPAGQTGNPGREYSQPPATPQPDYSDRAIGFAQAASPGYTGGNYHPDKLEVPEFFQPGFPHSIGVVGGSVAMSPVAAFAAPVTTASLTTPTDYSDYFMDLSLFVPPPPPDNYEYGTIPNVPVTDDTSFPFVPAGGGSSSVFMGKVTSNGDGSGELSVYLYQNGPLGDPDQDPVNVLVPMLADGEVVPEDTWLAGIFQFTDNSGNTYYACQPPVWLS